MDKTNPFLIQELPEFSPQIGRLVCLMNYARMTTLNTVTGLTIRQLDHVHDSSSNSIGALLLHAVAVEYAYQCHTFEQRDLTLEETETWGAALDLGERGRNEIRGHPLDWYAGKLAEMREATLRGFRARDDKWLMTEVPFWDGKPANYHFMWFHVLEDEINTADRCAGCANGCPD